MAGARLRLPDWRVEGRDWPHREHSRFLERGGLRWHAQVMGSGPPLLLLHGTGASSHSFRDLLPLLASRFTVVAPDLPGHAFTRVPRGFSLSLPAMAAAVADLCAALALPPVVAVGHSAGAAILARMALDGAVVPRLLVGLASAMLPLRGPATALFAPAARLLGGSASAARILALQAGSARAVSRMIEGTGSLLDARGVELYRRLAQSPGHVAHVLAMLAAWDLTALEAALPRLRPSLLLLAGVHDKATPQAQQREVARRVPGARVVVVQRAGHLLHEERPDAVARLILDEAEAQAGSAA